MDRLDVEARKLLELRADYDIKRKAADNAEDDKKEQERLVWDLLKTLNQKSSGTIELGGDFGDVELGREETITGRIIDHDAALEAFEKEARADEITKIDFRQRQVSELVRERLTTGQPLPPGVDFIKRPYIRVSKKKRRR